MSLTDLLGRRPNGKAPATESEALLEQLKAEREALATLVEQARTATRDLGQMMPAVDQLRQATQAVGTQTSDLGERVRTIEGLTAQLPALQSQAQTMTSTHRRVERQVSTAAADANRLATQVAELRDTVQSALQLKEDMAGLVAKAASFTELRAEADELSGALRNLSANFTQMRDQHDGVMEVYQAAAARLEKFDDQFRRMTETVAASDRRADELERKFKEIASVAEGITDTRRQLETLNSLAGFVTKKVAAVEQQRDAVERATAEAQNLQELVRQITAETERQRDKARGLVEFEEHLDRLRKAHGELMDRTTAIAGAQGTLEEAVSGTRSELGELRAELKKAGERFELESRGLDGVGQRIVSLRGSVTEMEERFQALERSRGGIAEAEAAAATVAAQLDVVARDVKATESALQRVEAIGNEAQRLEVILAVLADRFGRIDAARPAIEAAVADLTELRQGREAVRDALEQMRVSHAEVARFRETHMETQTWLEGVEGALHGVEGKVQFLDSVRPLVEQLGKDVERVLASVESVESRRQFLEQLHSRLAEVGARSTQVEERAQQLERRMEGAEKRFVSLSLQADDAERVARVVFGVTRQVEESERRMAGIVGTIGTTEGRFREVEALAERVRQIGADLEQRENALERAAEQLQNASTLRSEAAALLEDLEAQTSKLVEGLSRTEARGARVDGLAAQIEERASNLRFVERRMAQFEEQLGKWELADQEVRRALDDIAQRQAAIDGLRADIQHMFTLAERTMEQVRAVGEAREEVRSTHELVEAALLGVADGKRVVEHLEWRKGQLDQLESRLARADALVMDLNASLVTLETQRAVVEQVVSQAGALEFQSKQAEALLETLRNERDLATRIHSAIGEARKQREVKSAS